MTDDVNRVGWRLVSLNLVIGYHKSQEVGGTRLPGRLSSFVRAFHALLDNNAGRGGLALCAPGRLDACAMCWPLLHTTPIPYTTPLVKYTSLLSQQIHCTRNSDLSERFLTILVNVKMRAGCNSHLSCLVVIHLKSSLSQHPYMYVPQSHLYRWSTVKKWKNKVTSNMFGMHRLRDSHQKFKL